MVVTIEDGAMFFGISSHGKEYESAAAKFPSICFSIGSRKWSELLSPSSTGSIHFSIHFTSYVQHTGIDEDHQRFKVEYMLPRDQGYCD